MSFTQKEKGQINKNYFTIIRELDVYFEVMSKNTEHLWIIKKTINNSADKPFIIYHKHNMCIPYYHRHGYAYSLLHAIKQIKSHDKYVLETKELNEYNKSKLCLTQN